MHFHLYPRQWHRREIYPALEFSACSSYPRNGPSSEVTDTVVFMDGGVVVGSGPLTDLINHRQHPRTQEFLSSIV